MVFTPHRLIWHHTADASQAHQLAKINAWHKSKGFPLSRLGLYVGYHYLIEHDGTVVQCREETEIGAHDQGENWDSLGIGIAGDFDLFLPNESQAIAAARVAAEICARHAIPITHIEPHRRDDDTACPGKNLPDNWLIKQMLTRNASPLRRAFHWIGEYEKLL